MAFRVQEFSSLSTFLVSTAMLCNLPPRSRLEFRARPMDFRPPRADPWNRRKTCQSAV
jgi:hypothetical protein